MKTDTLTFIRKCTVVFGQFYFLTEQWEQGLISGQYPLQDNIRFLYRINNAEGSTARCGFEIKGEMLQLDT